MKKLAIKKEKTEAARLVASAPSRKKIIFQEEFGMKQSYKKPEASIVSLAKADLISTSADTLAAYDNIGSWKDSWNTEVQNEV